MHVPAAEEQARADFYALLAALLLKAPPTSLLHALAEAPVLQCARAGPGMPEPPLSRAWRELVDAAGRLGAAAIHEEFDLLFISVGTPAVNPYGSRYLAGFMMEKPLAALRDDLRALGLSRTAGCGELEDHLGALCEVMRLLVAGGGPDCGRSIARQKVFFFRHVAPWYRRCLDDMQGVRGADFYRSVASFAQAFFAVESEAFEIADADTGAAAPPDFIFEETDHA